jgi:hypothetical protein
VRRSQRLQAIAVALCRLSRNLHPTLPALDVLLAESGADASTVGAMAIRAETRPRPHSHLPVDERVGDLSAADVAFRRCRTEPLDFLGHGHRNINAIAGEEGGRSRNAGGQVGWVVSPREESMLLSQAPPTPYPRLRKSKGWLSRRYTGKHSAARKTPSGQQSSAPLGWAVDAIVQVREQAAAHLVSNVAWNRKLPAGRYPTGGGW